MDAELMDAELMDAELMDAELMDTEPAARAGIARDLSDRLRER